MIKPKKQGVMGNPTNIKIANAKADYKKAVSGGAAKSAKKLTEMVDTGKIELGTGYGTGIPAKKIYEDSGSADKIAVKQNIINDRAKTAMRAKLIESNIKRKKALGKNSTSKPKASKSLTGEKAAEALKKRTSPKGVKEYEKGAKKALDKKYPGLYKKNKGMK